MQRIRTPWREIRDVDLGPKPANLFAPAGGGAVRVGGELVVGKSGSAIDFARHRPQPETRP